MFHIFNFLAVAFVDDVIYLYLAYAAIAAAAVGAGVSYVGAQKAADAADQAGKQQKEAADAAARNSELQAAESIRRERINKRRRLARLRSDMNAGGVVMADSTMDVFAETAGREEINIQDAARTSNMDAANTRNQGSMSLWEARASARATRISSYGTLLSDTSKVGTSYAATR